MKRNPKNIVSGIAARRLIDATVNTNHAMADGMSASHVFSLRHCTINSERSGGVVVTVRPNKTYEHGVYYHDREFSRRLRPNYSMNSLIKAIGRCHNESIEAKHIRDVRERLYNMVENRGLNQDAYDEIADTGEAHGFNSAYESMTEKDVSYWRKAIIF